MFRQMISDELARIQRLIDLTDLPDLDGAGSLHPERRGKSVYWYEQWYEKGKRTDKKYLGKHDSQPVIFRAQALFKEERLKRLLHDQKLIEKLQKDYLDYDNESVIAKLRAELRETPDIASFNQRYEEIRAWANADYPKNNHPFPKAEIYAKDGTRVRSKGECLIYNILLEQGVLFRYDCLITFTNDHGESKTLSPDFLIQCFDGSYIIIEHLGQLTDMKYALDFGMKCHWYLQQNFVLNKNFFVTSDDKFFGTDSHIINEIANKIISLFYGS